MGAAVPIFKAADSVNRLAESRSRLRLKPGPHPRLRDRLCKWPECSLTDRAEGRWREAALGGGFVTGRDFEQHILFAGFVAKH